MATDSVRVTQTTVVTDERGNRSHYDVTIERREAALSNYHAGRIALTIRCNGIERVHVEMPGEVGAALLWAVRDAFEKFDIEGMTGRKVSL